MSSSRIRQPTREALAARPERSRGATPKALVWLMIAAIAPFPFLFLLLLDLSGGRRD